MRIDVVADWDKGTQWTLFTGKKERQATREDMLTATFWERLAKKTFVVEKAHFAPQLRASLAQIYVQEELNQIAALAKRAGVKIFVLPEAQAARACNETGVGEDDGLVTTSYHRFYNKHPEITLQGWPVVENPGRKETLEKIRLSSNELLNELRTLKYDHPMVERAAAALAPHLPTLSATAIAFFQIKKKRDGSLDFNEPRVMSIFASVHDKDGVLWRNPAGKFVGVATVWDALSQNPYKSKKSGTARSNIMHHGLKNFLGPKKGGKRVKLELKDIPRGQARAEVRRALKDMICIFRDASLEQEQP